MGRLPNSYGKRNNWVLKKTNDDGEIIKEITFKNQKAIAEHLGVNIGVVKIFTCKTGTKCKCKVMRKSTKERWENIIIERIKY